MLSPAVWGSGIYMETSALTATDEQSISFHGHPSVLREKFCHPCTPVKRTKGHPDLSSSSLSHIKKVCHSLFFSSTPRPLTRPTSQPSLVFSKPRLAPFWSPYCSTRQDHTNRRSQIPNRPSGVYYSVQAARWLYDPTVRLIYPNYGKTKAHRRTQNSRTS